VRCRVARRLFGNLNRDLLGPPGDGNVIILSDSDEEEEALEMTATDAAPSAAVKFLTPATSTANADEDPKKMQDDNICDLASGLDTCKSSGGRDEVGSP
jgi:hypothetical protein